MITFDRYQYNDVIIDLRNRRVIETTVFPVIPRREDDVYVYSVKGDRLDLIAYDYYGDATLWFIIASVNNLGHGSLALPPGIQLRIPASPDEFLTAMRDAQTR